VIVSKTCFLVYAPVVCFRLHPLDPSQNSQGLAKGFILRCRQDIVLSRPAPDPYAMLCHADGDRKARSKGERPDPYAPDPYADPPRDPYAPDPYARLCHATPCPVRDPDPGLHPPPPGRLVAPSTRGKRRRCVLHRQHAQQALCVAPSTCATSLVCCTVNMRENFTMNACREKAYGVLDPARHPLLSSRLLSSRLLSSPLLSSPLLRFPSHPVPHRCNRHADSRRHDPAGLDPRGRESNSLYTPLCRESTSTSYTARLPTQGSVPGPAPYTLPAGTIRPASSSEPETPPLKGVCKEGVFGRRLRPSRYGGAGS
jgi:hypothetical protein